MNLDNKELPGVTYVKTREELETLALESVKKDHGDYLTSSQVKALLSLTVVPAKTLGRSASLCH